MISAVFCVLFGLSLLPGRTPMCTKFARRISGGIMPDGAEGYCRRLTWVWFFILLGTATLSAIDWRLGFVTPIIIALTFTVEGYIRRRRFSMRFNTSGSTGKQKQIVKTFESLARETACHRDFYRQGALAEAGDDAPVFLATVEPHHMYGTLWREMLPKALGCDVDPAVILTPEELVAKMKAAKKVFLVTTPSFLERFTAYASRCEVPQNCVEITTSASMLSSALSHRTRDVFGVAPREIFGSTETGGIAWRRQINGDEPWQVLDAVKITALPDGRLVVRSPYSFRRRFMLGDAVEILADGRSFRLLGRVDRIVKINEHRVNLAEMEDRIRALGFADCALAVLDGARGARLGALLVRGDAARECGNESALELRRRLLPVFPKGTVPKKFRVVREIPRNAQGKVVAAEVKARLECAVAEPVVLSFTRLENCVEAVVRFDDSYACFDGHFPGFAILPGVAQLGLAAQWGADLTGDATRKLKSVRKMKFTKMIRPGDVVAASLNLKSPDEVEYEFKTGGERCSSGVLVY